MSKKLFDYISNDGKNVLFGVPTTEELIGREIRGVKISAMSELEEYMKTNQVDIAAVAIPREPAPEVAALLVKWGARSIWNFAPTDLHLPEDVKVENVHLADSLLRLSYNLKVE